MDLGLSERAAPLVTAMGAALGLKGAPPAPTGRRRAIPGRAIGSWWLSDEPDAAHRQITRARLRRYTKA
jgi:hypothetical protein